MRDNLLDKAAKSGSPQVYFLALLKETREFQEMKERVTPETFDAEMGKLLDQLNAAMAKTFAHLLDEQPQVVRDFDELKRICSFFRQGMIEEIERLLDAHLAEAKRWWKQKLGIPRHRRADPKLTERYSEAARLRYEQGLSWAQVAQRLDPQGYKTDRKSSIDRFQKGVRRLRRIIIKVHNTFRKGEH
jgi:hypothetical protein